MIAEVLSKRLGAVIVPVDPIESAILNAGIDSGQPTGLAAYLVAETIADRALLGGQTVIVDAVNAVDPAREQWIALADRHHEVLRFLEVVCSDPELHRTRLENRRHTMPHFAFPSWRAVEQSLEDYAPWTGTSAAVPRITLDSVLPLGVNIESALAFLEP
jgi:predicted kinase